MIKIDTKRFEELEVNHFKTEALLVAFFERIVLEMTQVLAFLMLRLASLNQAWFLENQITLRMLMKVAFTTTLYWCSQPLLERTKIWEMLRRGLLIPMSEPSHDHKFPTKGYFKNLWGEGSLEAKHKLNIDGIWQIRDLRLSSIGILLWISLHTNKDLLWG